MNKQKIWEETGNIEAIREYGRWRQDRFRERHPDRVKKLRDYHANLKKIDTLIKQKNHSDKQIQNKLWYLNNKERLKNEYHLKSKTGWYKSVGIYISISKADRDFVLNFKPTDFPKYMEALQLLSQSNI